MKACDLGYLALQLENPKPKLPLESDSPWAPILQIFSQLQCQTRDKPPNTLKPLQTPSNSLELSRTLSNSFELSQTLSNSLEISQTLSNSLKFSQTLLNSLKFSQTLSNSLKLYQTPSKLAISSPQPQTNDFENYIHHTAEHRSLGPR